MLCYEVNGEVLKARSRRVVCSAVSILGGAGPVPVPVAVFRSSGRVISGEGGFGLRAAVLLLRAL